ncbi:replicative DNA helicase [Verrucomicrobium spinosum]|uniref:replicative DNA helicase n=2 Tax=Verrucomicrobium spinosum TaxID=2736 RepID=UPI00031BA1A0|nr:DnaB-like helicase C-terminal domain-containing protein [Verrucomicrobium spinosum]
MRRTIKDSSRSLITQGINNIKEPNLPQALANSTSSNMSNRTIPADTLPYSEDAEKGLLSCFLQTPDELIGDAIRTLPQEVFHQRSNRLLYGVLRDFHTAGRPIDLVSLSHHLLDSGDMDKVGGPATLADLLSFVPTPAHYEYYKGILKSKFMLRKMQQACHDGLGKIAAHDPAAPVTDTLAELEQAIIRIREEGECTGAGRSWAQLLSDATDRYEEAIRNPGQLPGMSTGYPHLDAATGGFRKGHVWTIGGGTSDGKSAFTQNLVVHLGREKVPTCIYSLEMTDDENADRLVSIFSGIPCSDLVQGLRVPAVMKSFAAASSAMRGWPLHVRDVSGIKLSALRADMRSQVRRHGVRVFFLDYLQLVTADQRGHTREREVAEMSGAMKADAKLLGVTVINLSQLNDEGKLRESRAIGQDSDVVATLHVPERAEGNDKVRMEDKRLIELVKVRGGARGVWINYDFHGPTFRFIERQRAS